MRQLTGLLIRRPAADIPAAGFAARSWPPPFNNCERDEKADAGCYHQRNQDGIMAGQRRIDGGGKDPQLRDIHHDQHD